MGFGNMNCRIIYSVLFFLFIISNVPPVIYYQNTIQWHWKHCHSIFTVNFLFLFFTVNLTEYFSCVVQMYSSMQSNFKWNSVHNVKVWEFRRIHSNPLLHMSSCCLGGLSLNRHYKKWQLLKKREKKYQHHL